ncbi:MAG: hypothetical protein AAF387_01270 [Pseudomonadota bacterium]
MVYGDWLHTFEYPDKSCIAIAFFGSEVDIKGDNVFIGDFPSDSVCGLSVQVHQFDVGTGEFIRSYPQGWTGIVGDEIGAISGFSTTYFFNLDNGASLGQLDAAITHAEYQDTLLTGNKLFNLNTRELIQTFEGGGGFSGDVNTQYVILGNHLDSEKALRGGKADLFSAQSGAIVRTFYAPMPRQDGRFGKSVAIHNNKILISSRGNAYLFDAPSGNLIQTFEPPNPPSGLFGSEIAMNDQYVVIGDWGSNEVHVYSINRNQQSIFTVPFPINILILLGSFYALFSMKCLESQENRR